jgi:type IV pilus assembly protein PilE
MQRGAVLLTAMAISVALALMSVSVLHVALGELHGAWASVEALRAFHAADAALAACERKVRAVITHREASPLPSLREPLVLQPWPGSVIAPACTVEWIAPTPSQPPGYRIDAIGYGSMDESRAYARVDVWVERGVIHSRWSTPSSEPSDSRRRDGVRPSPSSGFRNKSGFTLIELLCALTIVAILACYALPTYREYTVRAQRLEAALALRRGAQYLEVTRLIRAAVSNRGSAGDALTLSDGLPDEMTVVPAGVQRPLYRIVVHEEGSFGTTLEAAPVSGAAMERDRCGVFILDETGHESVTGVLDPSLCWRGS